MTPPANHTGAQEEKHNITEGIILRHPTRPAVPAHTRTDRQSAAQSMFAPHAAVTCQYFHLSPRGLMSTPCAEGVSFPFSGWSAEYKK